MTTTQDRLDGHDLDDTHEHVAVEAPNVPADHPARDTQVGLVGGDTNIIRSDQGCTDTQRSDVAAEQTPHPATPRPTPTAAAPGGASISGDHAPTDSQGDRVAAPTPPAPATNRPTPKVASPVRADPDGRPATMLPPPPKAPASLADPVLALTADMLDDLERVHIANANRLRQLTRSGTDADGVRRGLGLPDDDPRIAPVAALVEASARLEHDAVLQLQRLLRKHPLGPWMRATIGIGEKQGARLLAAIGDPWWNTLHNRPRTVSELWAYAGYHVLRTGHVACDAQANTAGPEQSGGHPDQSRFDAHVGCVGVAAVRRRGARANWSATAKMRTFLVAESCMKQRGSPYREVYEAGREKYAESAVHAVACTRCGPAGKPAPAGSALSDGHQHARALRLVSKAILRDLWREAARLHGAAE